MKQTNINIDEIKRYPTVTNPIKADDLHTPQAYAYTLRHAIVTDCTPEQRAELVKLLEGKDTAEGVTFRNTQKNRDRLHIWQNSESRKERAAILGEGWQYVEGLNSGTEPGDLIACLDGTQGRVTKSSPESCVIEFETADGHRHSVAGYFRYTPSEKSKESREFTNPDDDRQVLATMEAGRVKFYADWLPLFDILENLGGMPEGDRKQFRCHTSDLYDVVENIGVHINCPHVYLPEDHNALMDMISEAGTDLQHLRAMISVYKAMAKKQDGYVWFEAA